MAKRAPQGLWSRLGPIVRQNRALPTEAEEVLWQAVRRKGVSGFKFRRQHVIDRFVVDFYCARARLVVEVDGPIHDFTKAEDADRQAFLESLNLRVLRFTNDEVLIRLEEIVERIKAALTSPPAPSLQRGEGDPPLTGVGGRTRQPSGAVECKRVAKADRLPLSRFWRGGWGERSQASSLSRLAEESRVR